MNLGCSHTTSLCLPYPLYRNIEDGKRGDGPICYGLGPLLASFFGVEEDMLLPCEQSFLSCMAFSVYEVVRGDFSVAYLVCSRGVNKLTTRQKSHANDFVNGKSHAREKPLLSG